MLTYKLIDETDEYQIFEYYPENHREAPGVIKIFANGSIETLKESERDFHAYFKGHAVTGINKSKKEGIVAWY